MNKQNQKLWEDRIKDYENSGLTMNAWCEKNNIKIHQLHYWRRKFKNFKQEKLQLVPLNLDLTRNNTINDSVKIQVGKLSLEVHTGFNPTLLKDVMKVLMEVC